MHTHIHTNTNTHAHMHLRLAELELNTSQRGLLTTSVPAEGGAAGSGPEESPGEGNANSSGVNRRTRFANSSGIPEEP